ncbi:MAG: hypothetical protein II913_02440 [Elusimicrobiaceae bacterium]|nr:hypothetical protein [Elusimicrobiaceae bacterium]
MPAKTLLELDKTLRAVSRVRARLTKLNRHKLPIYWASQPRVFLALDVLENALQTDLETLLALQQNPHKVK